MSKVKFRKKDLDGAIGAARRAIELAPDGAVEGYLYLGIAIGDKAKREGTKRQLETSLEIKAAWEKAADERSGGSNTDRALANNLLGRWALAFAQMSWMTRKIASSIFAEVPTATVEEALACFQAAEDLCPRSYKNNLMHIGKCQLLLGNKAKAKEALDAAETIPLTDAESKEDAEEIRKLLRNV